MIRRTLTLALVVFLTAFTFQREAPLTVSSSRVYKEDGKWFLHVVGYKNRRCGIPELWQWQSNDNRTFMIQNGPGADSPVGRMDRAFQIPVIEFPGSWTLETIVRYPCHEGPRSVPIETRFRISEMHDGR